MRLVGEGQNTGLWHRRTTASRSRPNMHPKRNHEIPQAQSVWRILIRELTNAVLYPYTYRTVHQWLVRLQDFPVSSLEEGLGQGLCSSSSCALNGSSS